MKKRIAFTNETRESIITEQQALGFRLYEEQRYIDGWWLLFTDEPYEPTQSTHISTLVAVDPTKNRPARIKRVWQGQDYYYNCFVTQTVKDEFVAGKIVIGDYVLVHFDDIGEQIVTMKVWKSW